MTQFDDDVSVAPTGPGTYSTSIKDNWNVAIGPNGGYISAIILNALITELDDPDRVTRSVAFHYLSAASPGPASLEVHTEKIGRSLATLHGKLVQGDRTIAYGLATFAAPRGKLEFQDFEKPQVADPADIDPSHAMNPTMVGHVPFRDHYDTLLAIGPIPPDTAQVARVGGWTRLRKLRQLDSLSLVAMSDSWLPSIAARYGASMTAPTIDHTVHFFTTPPYDNVGIEDYVLAEFSTRVAREGFLQEDGRIWAPDGTLLVQSRQLALILTDQVRSDKSQRGIDEIRQS